MGNAVEAAGHVALCITEELWTLSGGNGVSNLVESLAKVLRSLALPEDQVDMIGVKSLLLLLLLEILL